MALKELWQRTTPLDRIIVAAMLLICLALTLLIGLAATGETLRVRSDNRTVFRADLETDRQVGLRGPLGTTELEIRDGKARVVASPCPFKVCIGMGEISRAGEIIACVPNRLVIEVKGRTAHTKEQSYDLLSR